MSDIVMYSEDVLK